MNKFFFFLIALVFFSCSTKNQTTYLDDAGKYQNWSLDKINQSPDMIQKGDILKIDIRTLVQEAAIPYNTTSNLKINSIDILKLNGYLVDHNSMISFPVLGKINTSQLTLSMLEDKLKDLLILNNHLTDPSVIVRRLNAKFTILGEVNTPSTFNFYDQKINIFQALGYAGDLTIGGKRNDITLVRFENGLKKIYNIKLNDLSILDSPLYYIKNNDVIIVNPTFSKIKSAGFVGSPASIASIASLLLSVTLLIIN